ncbi:MAG: hypothetical protein QW692_04015 [Nitrososphaerota archaeon]
MITVVRNGRCRLVARGIRFVGDLIILVRYYVCEFEDERHERAID